MAVKMPRRSPICANAMENAPPISSISLNAIVPTLFWSIALGLALIKPPHLKQRNQLNHRGTETQRKNNPSLCLCGYLFLFGGGVSESNRPTQTLVRAQRV